MSNATAFIPRTNNVDRFNASVYDEEIFNSNAASTEEITMGIAEDGFEIILSMLSDLSADRGAYALREAWSNAYDATVATGDMTRKIEIILPDPDMLDDNTNLTSALTGIIPASSNLQVIDNGVGMTADDVKRFFCQYGGSKKRNEKDMIGSKGLGSKAGLAVSDSMTVRTVRDGIETLAIIERKSGRNTATVKTREIEAGNGTVITIPVSDASIARQMVECAKNIARYNLDANLWINGQKTNNILENSNDYTYAGEIAIGEDENGNPVSFRTWLRTPSLANHFFSADINLAGVRYSLAERRWANEISQVIVAGDPGYLNFTPSRDEIKKDEFKTRFAEAVLYAANHINRSEVINNRLAKCETWEEVMEWVSVSPYQFNVRYCGDDAAIFLGDNIVSDENLVKEGINFADALRLSDQERVMVFGKYPIRIYKNRFVCFTPRNNETLLLCGDKSSSTDLKLWTPKCTIGQIATNHWGNDYKLAIVNIANADELRLLVVHDTEIRRQIGNYLYVVVKNNPEFTEAEEKLMASWPRFTASALIEVARETKRQNKKNKQNKQTESRPKASIPAMAVYSIANVKTLEDVVDWYPSRYVIAADTLGTRYTPEELAKTVLVTGSSVSLNVYSIIYAAACAKIAGDLDANTVIMPANSKCSNIVIDTIEDLGVKVFWDNRPNMKNYREGILDNLDYLNVNGNCAKFDATNIPVEIRKDAWAYGIVNNVNGISTYDTKAVQEMTEMFGIECFGEYSEAIADYSRVSQFATSNNYLQIIDRNEDVAYRRRNAKKAIRIASDFYEKYSVRSMVWISDEAKQVVYPALAGAFEEYLAANNG